MLIDKINYPYIQMTYQIHGEIFFLLSFFPLESRLIASFVGASVIDHGILAGNYLAKCHDSLISQSLMYVGDRQSLGIKMAAKHKIQM